MTNGFQSAVFQLQEIHRQMQSEEFRKLIHLASVKRKSLLNQYAADKIAGIDRGKPLQTTDAELKVSFDADLYEKASELPSPLKEFVLGLSQEKADRLKSWNDSPESVSLTTKPVAFIHNITLDEVISASADQSSWQEFAVNKISVDDKLKPLSLKSIVCLIVIVIVIGIYCYMLFDALLQAWIEKCIRCEEQQEQEQCHEAVERRLANS